MSLKLKAMIFLDGEMYNIEKQMSQRKKIITFYTSPS